MFILYFLTDDSLLENEFTFLNRDILLFKLFKTFFPYAQVLRGKS